MLLCGATTPEQAIWCISFALEHFWSRTACPPTSTSTHRRSNRGSFFRHRHQPSPSSTISAITGHRKASSVGKRSSRKSRRPADPRLVRQVSRGSATHVKQQEQQGGRSRPASRLCRELQALRHLHTPGPVPSSRAIRSSWDQDDAHRATLASQLRSLGVARTMAMNALLDPRLADPGTAPRSTVHGASLARPGETHENSATSSSSDSATNPRSPIMHVSRGHEPIQLPPRVRADHRRPVQR
jgi:hypothetical protein